MVEIVEDSGADEEVLVGTVDLTAEGEVSGGEGILTDPIEALPEAHTFRLQG